jgi:hypothetical protein
MAFAAGQRKINLAFVVRQPPDEEGDVLFFDFAGLERLLQFGGGFWILGD